MRYRIAFILFVTIVALGLTAATGHAEEPAPQVQIGTAVRAYGGGSAGPPPPAELPRTGPDRTLWYEAAAGLALVALGALGASRREARRA